MPDLTDDESRESVVSAVEVQEALDKFKDLTMSKVREVRDNLNSLDREAQLLERARSDSWEVISQRLNTMVDSSVSALSDRMSELGKVRDQSMQSMSRLIDSLESFTEKTEVPREAARRIAKLCSADGEISHAVRR